MVWAPNHRVPSKNASLWPPSQRVPGSSEQTAADIRQSAKRASKRPQISGKVRRARANGRRHPAKCAESEQTPADIRKNTRFSLGRLLPYGKTHAFHWAALTSRKNKGKTRNGNSAGATAFRAVSRPHPPPLGRLLPYGKTHAFHWGGCSRTIKHTLFIGAATSVR